MNGNQIIKYYKEDHYTSIFNQKTGLFIRKEDTGYKEPSWASHGPELLDISITNYCTKLCEICYRNSNLYGHHMSILDLKIILKQAKEIGVQQIAIGGGNPNQHPHFIEILELIRQKYCIVPSYTTNGVGINDNIIKATKENCGVIAVSISSFRKQNYDIINKLINADIKTNIHFTVTSETLDEGIFLLENKREIPQNINAIIFLNFKPVGKAKTEKYILTNSEKIQHFFSLVNEKKIPCNIGFDSCFVSGICKYTNINPVFYDYCEAGRFSAFIDEGLNMYPCSFMIENQEKHSLLKSSIIDIWQNSQVFKKMRYELNKKICNCKYFENCHGGCKMFEINLCKKPYM
jgi:radical SAM protein with 4Fe4S-binding SPASM domain